MAVHPPAPASGPLPTESSPLIANPLLSSALSHHAPSPPTTNTPSYTFELTLLFHAALPIALSFALQNIIQALSILIVGTLGTFELGVASYGYIFASSTGSMIALGGATALDTLCSQAYTSTSLTERPFVLRNYFQRTVLFLAGFYTCVAVPLWWFSGDLFVMLGQEKEFAFATGRFLRFLIPGGLLQVGAECLKKYLQVQGRSFGTSCVIGVAALVGLLANVLFVRIWGLGYIGAPLAHTAYHASTVVGLLVYVGSVEGGLPVWRGFDLGKRGDWMILVGLAVTGTFTQAAEAFGFELLAIMTARLDQITIGAQSIIMATDLILYTIPLSISVASSHRIGNLLGAGSVDGVKFATRIPYILSLILGTIEFLLVILVRNYYGYLFSQDEPVVRLTAKVLPVIALFQVLDLSTNGACGILRGAGKTHLVLISNVLAYYGAGVTSAWYLCFEAGFGLVGLWSGLVIGSSVLLIVLTTWIVRVDWTKEVEIVSQQDHGKSIRRDAEVVCET